LPATQPLLPPLAGSLPAPPPSIILTTLLGQPPTPHLYTLYNLYAAQAATLLWSMEEAAGMSSPAGRLPVVVGVALKQTSPRDDEEGGVTEEQRELFREIMDMIQKSYSATTRTEPPSS
jgi:proteasome assembly chaperone 3